MPKKHFNGLINQSIFIEVFKYFKVYFGREVNGLLKIVNFLSQNAFTSSLITTDLHVGQIRKNIKTSFSLIEVSEGVSQDKYSI